MSDYITINGLKIFANHGAYDFENQKGQNFVLDIIIKTDTYKAGKFDTLEDTINYAKLCDFVTYEFTKNTYKLIETCANKLAEAILKSFDNIEEVMVTVKKPEAPMKQNLNFAAVTVTRKWHDVYISLGSNLGDKNSNIQKALSLLDSDETIVIKVSSIYETRPVGYLDQENFLNCAVHIKTLLSPKNLINFTMEIEKQLKRERIIHWGPRTIDIDILFYDDLVTNDEQIVLPHPRMAERLFVLTPLSEISPYLFHPILRKRIFELENALKNKGETL